MFTVEPVTSDNTKIVIEAVLGLGEAIVSGEVTPDLYIIDKDGLKTESKKIAKQEWQLIRTRRAARKSPTSRFHCPRKVRPSRRCPMR